MVAEGLKVLLDTNALMVPEQFGVDVFSELERHGYTEFLVPEPVLEELRILSTTARGLDRLAARVGLGLAGRCRLVEREGNADQALEDLSLLERAAVFTNDKALKKRLLSRGVTVVYLRQNQYLEIAMQKES
jgi:rRNA-processing protein FCF1